MIATNRNARDGGWLVRASRRLAFALTLAALCFASGAKADALSSGKRAFLRHDYVRAASLLAVEAARGSPVAQTYLGYMYQYGLGVPKRLCPGHELATSGGRTGRAYRTIPARPSVRQRLRRAAGLGCGGSLAHPCSGARRRDAATGIFRARSRRGRPKADARSARRGAAAGGLLGANCWPEFRAVFGEILKPLPQGASREARKASRSQEDPGACLGSVGTFRL